MKLREIKKSAIMLDVFKRISKNYDFPLVPGVASLVSRVVVFFLNLSFCLGVVVGGDGGGLLYGIFSSFCIDPRKR